MKSPGSQLSPGRYAQELNLLEQVHVALGTASKLEDFYLIATSILVDPNAFGYSRALVLRSEERPRSFTGRVALGTQSLEDHLRFREDILEETRRLQELIEAIQRENPEPRAIQPLYDLRFHSLWIHLLQGNDAGGDGLNSGFRELNIGREGLPENHLLERAAAATRATIFTAEDVDATGLEDYVRFPCVAGRLVTRRGMHGLLIADRQYEDTPIDGESLYHFQWLVNHASVSLENVELVEELTATTQRLQEVDRLKSNFLSIVSHELRTPLTSIMGFAQLLAAEKVGTLQPSQRDLMRRIEQHSTHLHNMVNDILEIAEVEGGGMVNVQVQPVDPLSCFISVLPKIEARRGNKQVTIEPLIHDSVPLVWADDAALERVLFHLLDNAVKFSPGEGRVTVEYEAREAVLDISVQDSGIGIPQDNLKKIFDHFYQVDFRLERSFGGMGIGLTVVKLLLDAMNGRIRVESTPGVGSRFTLTFPIAPGRSGAPAE